MWTYLLSSWSTNLHTGRKKSNFFQFRTGKNAPEREKPLPNGKKHTGHINVRKHAFATFHFCHKCCVPVSFPNSLHASLVNMLKAPEIEILRTQSIPALCASTARTPRQNNAPLHAGCACVVKLAELKNKTCL